MMEKQKPTESSAEHTSIQDRYARSVEKEGCLCENVPYVMREGRLCENRPYLQ